MNPGELGTYGAQTAFSPMGPGAVLLPRGVWVNPRDSMIVSIVP